MKKEDLVCDIEYVKKFRELGVKQNSIFSYVRKDEFFGYETKGNSFEEEYTLVDDGFLVIGVYTDRISAFTTDELLEMLPDKICLGGKMYYFEISKHVKTVAYQEPINNQMLKSFGYKIKLPNALVKLLIWCIENRYMEVK